MAPDHRFETISFGDTLPAADLGLAYTVLLHVDDANIKGVVDRITESFEKVLIVEIMEPRLRELPSEVPNYCRDRREHERLFAAYSMRWEIRRPYEWYRDQELDLSYLLLDRC